MASEEERHYFTERQTVKSDLKLSMFKTEQRNRIKGIKYLIFTNIKTGIWQYTLCLNGKDLMLSLTLLETGLLPCLQQQQLNTIWTCLMSKSMTLQWRQHTVLNDKGYANPTSGKYIKEVVVIYTYFWSSWCEERGWAIFLTSLKM